MRRAAATVLGTGSPQACADKACPGRPAVGIDEGRQLGATIETDGPASLAPHLLRCQLGCRLGDARPQMCALLARESLAARGGQAAPRILFGCGCAALARRRCSFLLCRLFPC